MIHRVRAYPRARLSGAPSIAVIALECRAAPAANVRRRAHRITTLPVLVAGHRPLVPERQGPAFALLSSSTAVKCGHSFEEGAAADH